MSSTLRLVRFAVMSVVLLALAGCSVLDQLNQDQATGPKRKPELVAQLMEPAVGVWTYLPDENAWFAILSEPLFPFPSRRPDVPSVSEQGEVEAQTHTTCSEDPYYDPTDPNDKIGYEVWQSADVPFPYNDDWNYITVRTTAWEDPYHTYNMAYASCRHDLQDKLGWPKTQLYMQNLSGLYRIGTSGPSGDFAWEIIATNGGGRGSPEGWALRTPNKTDVGRVP
jgi:hypothetical protein